MDVHACRFISVAELVGYSSCQFWSIAGCLQLSLLAKFHEDVLGFVVVVFILHQIVEIGTLKSKIKIQLEL